MPAGAPPFFEGMARGAQRVLGELETTMEQVRPDHSVAPGISLLPTPGHTPSHVSVLVEDEGQSLLIVGDALTNREVSLRHPDWPLATDIDQQAGAAMRQRLLDLLVAEDIPIIAFHFPFPGKGRVFRQNDGFQFAVD